MTDLYSFASVTEEIDGSLVTDIQKENSRKRLGATNKEHTFEMENPDDNVWVGSIFVGSAFSEISVLIDTATDIFAVDGGDCRECEGITFAPAPEDFEGPFVKSASYGEKTLYGREAIGSICLN